MVRITWDRKANAEIVPMVSMWQVCQQPAWSAHLIFSSSVTGITAGLTGPAEKTRGGSLDVDQRNLHIDLLPFPQIEWHRQCRHYLTGLSIKLLDGARVSG